MKLIIASAILASTQAAPANTLVDDYLDAAADYAPETVEALKELGNELVAETKKSNEGNVAGYDKLASDAVDSYKESVQGGLEWAEKDLGNTVVDYANSAVDYVAEGVDNLFSSLGVNFETDQFDKVKELAQEQKQELDAVNWKQVGDDFSFVDEVIEGGFNFPLQFAKKNMDELGFDFDYLVLGNEEFDAMKKKAFGIKTKFSAKKEIAVKKLEKFKSKPGKNFFSWKKINFSDEDYDTIIAWLNATEAKLLAKEGAEILEVADLDVREVIAAKIVAGHAPFENFTAKEVKFIQKFMYLIFKDLFETEEE